MIEYRVIVKDGNSFTHGFDGEPQINLTFEHDSAVYRVVTRAHDEYEEVPAIHVEMI